MQQIDMANRRFRVLESVAICRVAAVWYPSLIDWIESLESYHYFLMKLIPSREQVVLPFTMVDRPQGTHSSLDALSDELDRLRSTWGNRGRNVPFLPSLALAHWAIANWDGLRAAIWLRQAISTGGIGDQVSPIIKNGLASIVHAGSGAYGLQPNSSMGVDLYIALDSIARTLSIRHNYQDILDMTDEYKFSKVPVLVE